MKANKLHKLVSWPGRIRNEEDEIQIEIVWLKRKVEVEEMKLFGWNCYVSCF